MDVIFLQWQAVLATLHGHIRLHMRGHIQPFMSSSAGCLCMLMSLGSTPPKMPPDLVQLLLGEEAVDSPSTVPRKRRLLSPRPRP